MEKFIAQRNIAHFEDLLRNESDPNERRILESMLREERAKLAAAESHPSVASRYRFSPEANALSDVAGVPGRAIRLG